MATTFLGGSGVLRDDDCVVFGKLRFWAERGLIHIEDATTNDYKVMSVHECLTRMVAISEMLGNKRREQGTEDQFDTDLRKKNQDMLSGMEVVVRRAQRQGMPSDPTARNPLKAARPTTVCVPGLKDYM